MTTLPVWERTDWDSECFDLDSGDSLGATWYDHEDAAWSAEAMGAILSEVFQDRSEAEKAVEEIINEEDF